MVSMPDFMGFSVAKLSRLACKFVGKNEVFAGVLVSATGATEVVGVTEIVGVTLSTFTSRVLLLVYR